jgi:hypothetical protein
MKVRERIDGSRYGRRALTHAKNKGPDSRLALLRTKSTALYCCGFFIEFLSPLSIFTAVTSIWPLLASALPVNCT